MSIPRRRSETTRFCLSSMTLWMMTLWILCVGVAVAQDRPNIVLILSDDQAYSDYGFMGHDAIQTPVIDQLARQGTLFRRGYVPTALCRPSLMTLLTGHYATVHGVTGNDPSTNIDGRQVTKTDPAYNAQRRRLIDRLDAFESLPRALATAGYRSHQSGKLWEGSYQEAGFSEGMTRGFPQPGGRHGDDGLKIGRRTMQPIDSFVSKAAADDVPFFLWYAPFLPHSPHNPPAEILALYQGDGIPEPIARYHAMCHWFDQTCGQLMEILDRHGEAEETMIVYVCDNGWIQRPDSSKFALRSKQSPYEGGVRTPIIYHWPGVIPPADRSELTSSIDIYPTILAAAGVDPPKGLPGLNLLPSLTASSAIDRNQVFGEAYAHDIVDIDDPPASRLFRWTIRDRWKLLVTDDGTVSRYQDIHDRSDPSPKLFDLIDDPNETKNVAAERPELVSELSESIDQWTDRLLAQRQQHDQSVEDR